MTICWTFWPGEPPPLLPMSDGLTSRGGSTTAWASTEVLSTVRTTGTVSWVAAGAFVSAACWAGDLMARVSSTAPTTAITTNTTMASAMIRRRRIRL